MIDPADFSPEVKAALADDQGETQDQDTLKAIALAIVERREEAVGARKDIEAIWTEAEEAYIGIDDQNRGEFGGVGHRWVKPSSPDGPVTTNAKSGQKNTKATAFVRLTARYVDAGAGKLIEILLPPDDRPFSFHEMPVPELLKAKEDNSPVLHDGMGNAPLFRPLKPGEQPPQPVGPPPAAAGAAPIPVPPPAPATATSPTAMAAGAGQAPPGAPPPGMAPLTVKDFAQEKIEIARKSAKNAEDKVFNWMIECGRTAEVRKMIFDSARVGTGIIKGPIPITKRGMMLNKDGANGVSLIVKNKIIPATKWVDPWNCYPDPACGEDVHDGDYFLEKDALSERRVRKLKDEPGYIAAQIDKVLEEGPDKINVGDDGKIQKPGQGGKRKRFPVWYYYGTLKRDEYLALRTPANKPKDAKGQPSDELKADQEQVYAICTMINDTVVRAVLNPLESGNFPYRVFPWQRRTGSWAGIGVGEQMRVPQRMVNAATRAMLNNAGKSAGSQIVLDKSCIRPANGSMTVEPDKIWEKNADSAAMNDVRQAFMIFNIPNVTPQMLEIINYGMKLAEESTSIPLITQGQDGPTTPDTLGATQLQNSNANQLLRTIGYSFDDCVTEGEVKDYYEWFLLDPDVPDEDKAEFEIDAHGSVALVERAIQAQTIGQMGALTLNPAYGGDPKRWFAQYIKINRLDPKDFQYTPEELQRIEGSPPEAPVVTAAKITADKDIKVAVMGQQSDAQSIASEEKIEQAAQALEGQKVHIGATVDLHEMAQRRQDMILEYALKHGLTLLQAKTDLAQTTMKLQVQQQLNAQDNAVDLHKHHTQPPKPALGQKPTKTMKPPAQAPGRAKNGQAFSQA